MVMREWLSRFRRRWLRPGIVRGAAGRGGRHRALLLYTLEAFLPSGRAEGHQNAAQQRTLARVLGEMGYVVDVVDYLETRRRLLWRKYDLVVDLYPRRRPLYEKRLRPNAKKIAYLTGSDVEFSNRAERQRLDDLKRRRGIELPPRRQAEPIPRDVLADFDAWLYFGNARTLSTFAPRPGQRAYRLFNNGLDGITPTDPTLRNPRRFLFLGGYGQVHKGLDLLLETFAEASDLHLTVCSQFEREPDFVRAFRREMYGVQSVKAVGFVDVRSPRFRELQSTCGHLILPSCSEGEATNVTVGLSFGLPCVVSDVCGFDDPEIQVLPDCTPATIAAEVRRLAATPRADLETASRASVALMQRRYRPEHYEASVRAGLAAALGDAITGKR
jgi:glycosyltransferase involved in cell wall biosynthesis